MGRLLPFIERVVPSRRAVSAVGALDNPSFPSPLEAAGIMPCGMLSGLLYRAGIIRGRLPPLPQASR